LFDDLNESCDFKKNEWVLKNFFRSPNQKKPTTIDGVGLDTIEKDDEGDRPDITRIKCDVKYV
jgi:hypothetical protein